MRTKMEISDVLNLIAIILIPIAAVFIGQWLQNCAEKRKDKMQIFKILMTTRIYVWTPEMVNALNIIDVVFANDKSVRAAWKDLNDKYNVSNPDQQHLEKIRIAQYKLLEAIANSLGYKDKITWETIQNPYFPVGMAQQIDIQAKSQQNYFDILAGISKMIPENEPEKEEQNNGSNQ